MNKFAEQFQNDVVVRYQQKMAELVKRAEEEIPDLIPKTKEEQTAKSTPTKMTAEDVAKQIDFENNFYSKNTMPNEMGKGDYPQRHDISGIPVNLAGDYLNRAALSAALLPDIRKINNNGNRYDGMDRALVDKIYKPYNTALEDMKYNNIEPGFTKNVDTALQNIQDDRKGFWNRLKGVDIDTEAGYPAVPKLGPQGRLGISNSLKNVPTNFDMRYGRIAPGNWNQTPNFRAPVNVDELLREAYGFGMKH